MTSLQEAGYAPPRTLELQHERLALLAALLDPGTFRLLEALDVRPGMRCLEVGAGHGSVAAWLCQRVAPGGSVLATGLDITAPGELLHSNLQVREHDPLSEPLGEREFDLVHARLLLAGLRDPRAGIRWMLAALKPGGTLLVEEMDFVSVVPDPGLDADTQRLFARVTQAHNTILAHSDTLDPHYGRTLVGELSAAGLVRTGCEGRMSIWQGGTAGGRLWQLTLLQLRDALIASGLLTAEEVGTALELYGNARLRFVSQITMAAWGHRPHLARLAVSVLARA
ncbi:MAG: methyltransferase domain-containing protein [Conexibacteraceae bacterium]|nr:methyltransferase domain-containing protein [Conexibacteraceae bacterium]